MDGSISRKITRNSRIRYSEVIPGRKPRFGVWILLRATVQRIARIDRSVVLPKGSTDESPGVIGAWESAGILDVTHLFHVTRAGERLLLATVQAHTIRDGLISQSVSWSKAGQLILLRQATGRIYPNRPASERADKMPRQMHRTLLPGTSGKSCGL